MDIIDQLISDWDEERPASKPAPMAVIGRLIMLGNRAQTDAGIVLKKHGLSYTEFDILATLCRQGAPYVLKPTQLCDAVLLTSGAMTAALDRLNAKEMITREDDPKDRRVKTVRLTPYALTLIGDAVDARFALAAKEIDPLNAEERSQLATLLSKLM